MATDLSNVLMCAVRRELGDHQDPADVELPRDEQPTVVVCCWWVLGKVQALTIDVKL